MGLVEDSATRLCFPDVPDTIGVRSLRREKFDTTRWCWVIHFGRTVTVNERRWLNANGFGHSGTIWRRPDDAVERTV